MASTPGRPTFAYLCASLHTGAGPEVWKGIQETAEALNVHVIAFPGGRLGGRDDFESLRNRIFSLPVAPAIDGVLSWASSLSGVRGATELAKLHRQFDHLPLVTLADPLPGRPCVRFDVTTGMGALVDHLIDVHGYREFAFVRGPEAHLSAQERYLAFVDTLARHGLKAREDLITTPQGWDQGREALAELLDRRGMIPGRDFPVLIAASDLLAFSILRDLQSRGYRVPSDIAVVGFNDSRESQIANPPLTTVHLPFKDQAAEGLKLLHALWRNEAVPEDTLLPTRLVLRQSCTCRSRELARAVSTGEPTFTDLGFTTSEIQAWIHPLQEALSIEVAPHRDRRFLDLLERILERVNTTRFTASVWQTVLSELRRGRVVLDRGLEDLFGQARVLVGEAAVREFSFQQWQRDQKAEQVRSLSRALQGALDPRRLSEILTRRLPDLGFRSGWLVRRESETSDRAVLMGSFTDRGRIDLPPEGLDFPVVSILPPGTLPDRRRTLVVEPLYYREHSLGYLVLEASGGEGEVYEELRTAVSTALKTALLLDSESATRQDRFFDPLELFDRESVPELFSGWDRLPYCLGDPVGAASLLESGVSSDLQVTLDGPGLTFDLGQQRTFKGAFPTLGGQPGSLEGDRLVLLSEVAVSTEQITALEEVTALGALVLDPATTLFEEFASLRPPLCVLDWETAGEATYRVLALLGQDPGWRTVPFLIFPPRTRTLPLADARGLLDLLPAVRTPEEGLRVLFIGTPLPPVAPGFTFRSVPSGIQAIPLLQQDRSDLVVSSSGGTGFRGLDLVEFLSSDPALASLRVLVLAEGSLKADEWVSLENASQVAVQLQGIWSPSELVGFLETFARRTVNPSLRVKKALAWLVAHHAHDVARWLLADYLAVSEDHLTREFRRELGMTPWEFLTRYRILQARKALESGSMRLVDVAREVGYHDLSYFCRVFRNETGTTPQKYRDTAKRLGVTPVGAIVPPESR